MQLDVTSILDNIVSCVRVLICLVLLQVLLAGVLASSVRLGKACWLFVIREGRRGDIRGSGRWGLYSSSWVMVGMLVPVLPMSSDATTAHGYTTISRLGLLGTLGCGVGSLRGMKIVSATLEDGRCTAVIASRSSCFVLCLFLGSATLGDTASSTVLISTLVLLVIASWKIWSRRARACTSSLYIPGVLCVCRVSVIWLAAAMMASSGVSVGFVMYLCLKKTVSDTLVDFVFRFHRFQHL